jgi:hypothetical protein
MPLSHLIGLNGLAWMFEAVPKGLGDTGANRVGKEAMENR